MLRFSLIPLSLFLPTDSLIDFFFFFFPPFLFCRGRLDFSYGKGFSISYCLYLDSFFLWLNFYWKKVFFSSLLQIWVRIEYIWISDKNRVWGGNNQQCTTLLPHDEAVWNGISVHTYVKTHLFYLPEQTHCAMLFQ